MSIKFEFYKTPQPKKDKKKAEVKYHARAVGGQTLDMHVVAKNISQRCSLSEGDFLMCITELSKEMIMQFCEGNRIYLPGIGYFSVTLDAPKDCNPKTTHAQNVKFKQVKFRADQLLKSALIKDLHSERAEVKIHSKSLTPDAIDQLLLTYFQTNHQLTRSAFQELCKLTTASSYRHVRRLVAEGKLVNINTPHSPLYEKGEALVAPE